MNARQGLFTLLLLLGVATDPASAGLRAEQDRAVERALVGHWEATVGERVVTLRLEPEHRAMLGDAGGAYTVDGGKLLLRIDRQAEGDGKEIAYDFKLIGDQLDLSGGDLAAPLTFTRQLIVRTYLADLLDISAESVWRKTYRILFILGVVLVARLVIAVLKGVSYLLVYSEWGPLRLVFRTNKNRVRTIHSLVLNLVKYFIYFTALGMILSELGVNYATYIASLSIVGLAIGFGSQGLVQDMVTGLFVILEGQFDVGDMVEISGQTGFVTELGLRMTKLRNYLGQTVVIPNRNITVVGNFSRGAQRAYIDVAVRGAEAATAAMPVLEQIGSEVMRQFEGVVLGPLRTTGPLVLATGEHFARLHLSIWPGQTWAVDQQLVPRIREIFKQRELVIPNDRVAVFYHARENIPVTAWSKRLPWRRGGAKK